MRKLVRSIADVAIVLAAQFEQRDLLLYVGLALLGHGLSLVYWPAAFIVPGVVLAAVAIFGVR